jgi:hypothetical protein
MTQEIKPVLDVNGFRPCAGDLILGECHLGRKIMLVTRVETVDYLGADGKPAFMQTVFCKAVPKKFWRKPVRVRLHKDKPFQRVSRSLLNGKELEQLGLIQKEATRA